jgi:hypothetical protein
MADAPANPKLYNSLSEQARTKYPNKGKGLGWAGAKWLKSEYEKQGGTFVISKKLVDPEKRDFQQEKKDAIKRKATDLKKKRKKQGFI